MTQEETRDIAIEARVLAREAHKRIGDIDTEIVGINTKLGLLTEQVTRVTTKVAVWAAIGAVMGSGVTAAILTFVLTHHH